VKSRVASGLAEQSEQHRVLGVHAVLRLIKNDRAGAVDDLVGHFLFESAFAMRPELTWYGVNAAMRVVMLSSLPMEAHTSV